MQRNRLSLRWRLALLYGGLLAVVSALLLALAIWLVDRAIVATASFAPGTVVRVRTSTGDDVVVSADDLLATLRDQATDALLRTGGVIFGLLVLAGAAIGYVVAARALRPVAQITATARRLSTETLTSRIELTGPRDELWELAATFDDMLARLDRAFDSQRRFVANASHELRTPLAVMRTEVDVALADPAADAGELRAMGERIRAATERADRLVDSLLLLARTEAQVRSQLDIGEEADLAGIVPAALSALAEEISAGDLRIDTELRPALAVGDPRLLERMVGNLVENAVRHNIDGGWARVQTLTGRAGVELCVDNSGPAVDPLTAAELFDPFRRGGAARASGRGAGLGLSIVSAVVAAHHGTIRAEPREGGGMRVLVRLPSQ
ncbi:MAG: HAMP domain-containing protein [Geodermatophilaceae bacterium]|nr:HAMP domain-containing protein [Geodermatophilaceae bacterium]